MEKSFETLAFSKYPERENKVISSQVKLSSSQGIGNAEIGMHWRLAKCLFFLTDAESQLPHGCLALFHTVLRSPNPCLQPLWDLSHRRITHAPRWVPVLPLLPYYYMNTGKLLFCTSLASINWYNGNSNKTKWQMNVRFTDMSRDYSVWVNITQRLGEWSLEAESQGSYSGSTTFNSCVILGKLVKLSVPQFPCLWNGYKNSTFCRGWQED